MVYCCIGHGIGYAIRVDLVDCKTDVAVVSEWLHELPHNVDMAGAVTRTGWDGTHLDVKRLSSAINLFSLSSGSIRSNIRCSQIESSLS